MGKEIILTLYDTQETGLKGGSFRSTVKPDANSVLFKAVDRILLVHPVLQWNHVHGFIHNRSANNFWVPTIDHILL